MTRMAWTPDLLEELARWSGVRAHTAAAARDEASQDFGRVARGDAFGVLCPQSTEQVRRIIEFARERGLALTARGGGMSQSGQSIPRGGLSLDLRAMCDLAEPDRDRMSVVCGPGATWRQLLSRLLPIGMIPRVVPLNLDLTVGGTLSAGGFGSTSHRYGPVVSNTVCATVVTELAERVECGPERERAVFDRVLGGVGEHGVIVGAELALRRAPPRVRTFYLAYDDFETMIRDQRALSEGSRADHVEGFSSSTFHGLRKAPNGRRQPLVSWSYGLHVSVEHDANAAPSSEEILHGLRPTKLMHVEDDTSESFAARYDVRFEAMRATGTWDLAHPWLECVLPWEAGLEIVPRALALLPAFLGDGHRLFVVADSDRPTSLAFPAKGPFLSFAVLPMGVPRALLDAALGSLKAVHDMALSAGGTRYRSGWLFDTSRPSASIRGTGSEVVFESCLSSP